MRKAIVEPVFGQMKSVRGLRRCSLRGFGLLKTNQLGGDSKGDADHTRDTL